MILYTYTKNGVIFIIDLCNSDNLLVVRNRITNICKSRGIKLSTICTKLQVTDNYFREIWSNRRKLTPEILLQVAKILHTNVDYLCGLTNDPEPDEVDYSIIVERPELQKVVDRLMKSDDEVIKKVNAFMDMINA